MKDRLEDFMLEHRNEFDIHEPDDKLWNGIEKNIKKQKGRSVSFYLVRAASVAAIFILTFLTQKYFIGNRSEIVIPELQEAELYYSGLMQMKMNEVKPMLVNDPMLQNELEHDLSELDSMYKTLKEDLKDNIANQEVLEAMISNYRLRISILEEMVMYLDEEEDNEENNNTSEYEL